MSTKFQFRAGMRYAKRPEVYEIAHIVEHLAFGANAKYSSEQAFEADFTKNGAYHNAWTSDYSVCYESECADFEWDRILELQRLSITQPRFNEDELRSEKGNVRAELTGYLNDYSRLLWPRLQQQVGEDVLDLPSRLRTISNIELKDIREHYRRTHTAQNLRFIIAGNLRHRKHKLIRALNAWGLKSGERFAIPSDDLHGASPVLIRRKDAANITFAFSWLLPRQLSPSEVYAMSCLNHILNGTMNSRIFGAADLFDLIHQELQKLLAGSLREQDLAAAKSYATGRYQMGAQTVNQISDYYADTYFTTGNFVKYHRVPALIRDLEPTTLINLAREFVSSNLHAFVAVSSVEKALINSCAAKLHFDL